MMMTKTDFSDFLPYLLAQAAEQTSRDFQTYYKARYGMLRNEWRVLFHLGYTGQQTAKQICDIAGLHKTKVSRAIRALERKRFVRRTENPEDRRSEFLTLTKLGEAALADLSSDAGRLVEKFVKTLGKDRHADLVATLHLLIAQHASPAPRFNSR